MFLSNNPLSWDINSSILLSRNLPNSTDPDHTPQNGAFNQGLHCYRKQLNKLNIPSDDQTAQRTSDSLNEGLPIKMTRKKFQRK